MNESIDTLAEAPEWFVEALRSEPTVAETMVNGARIVYRTWGNGASGVSCSSTVAQLTPVGGIT